MDEVDALYRDVGLRIAQERKTKGWTQERLAEEVDLNASYLARIEAGARKATVETLLRIADALDLSLAFLFSSEDSAEVTIPAQLSAALKGLTAGDLRILAQVAARFERSAKARPRQSSGRIRS